MAERMIKTLLIDDDQDDTLIIQEDFEKINNFKLDCVDTLAKGMNFIKSQNNIDVVLLDLNLPDSTGLDTVIKIKKEFPMLPIIALTGLDDEILSISVVQAGAQDYLVKGNVTSILLSHSIRYAIERQSLLIELERTRQQKQRARELSSLERLTQDPGTTITGKMYGLVSLNENAPDLFDEFVNRYRELMNMALEQRAFQMEDKLTIELRTMGDQLGFIKASARDVVEIHSVALKKNSQNAPLLKVQAYIEEGHFMMLELMGNLVMYYRKYYPGNTLIDEEVRNSNG